MSERRWHRDWITSGQPMDKCHCAPRRRGDGSYEAVFLWSQLDVTPASQIISQADTDEQPPPYVRTYSVERIARAFGVPLEALA